MPMSREDVLSALHEASPVIAPSMLKCDFGNLHREVELLEAADARLIHLDVMDGHFVPNLSYGPMVIERLRPLTRIPFEAHLMISEPERYLDEYLNAGCDMITFHIEAVPDPVPLLERIRQSGAAAGLALNPGTQVSALENAIPHCDVLLVMSVEPGFGGQEFIPTALDKLRRLQELKNPDTLLSVDGGIGLTTIASAASAGADVFVAGSSIFDQPDYRDAVSQLRETAESNRV